ncbi:MAG: lysophospholipid acyltransferase family protein [Planctomycetota bacterium]|jgi:KDO2-lipid IV(A) lauroyltransferase
MTVPRGFTRNLFDRISFTAFLTFRFAVNLLPRTLAATLGDLLALGWWLVDTHHRKLALFNLEIAFPSMHGKARRRIAFSCFRHLCKVLVETLRYGKLTAQNWHRYSVLRKSEHFEQALDKGLGVIAISGHLGNWEWLSVHAFKYGPVNIVARAIHNPFMDQEIRSRREAAGIHQIYPTRDAPRKILKALRSGEPVCFLVDQSAKGGEGVSVPFFGRPAPTHTGPALIALRSKAPVFPVFTVREPDGRIHLHYGEELDLIRTGDLQRDVIENTALFTRTVETAIRRHPEQWFWVHDRWRIKTRLRHGRRGKRRP